MAYFIASDIAARNDQTMLSSRHMRALVFEPHSDGHHGPYLHWMVTGLVDRGFEVTIITLPETLVHPSMQTLTSTASTEGAGSLRLIGDATSITLPSGATGGAAGITAREYAYWRLFRAWYKAYAATLRSDVVYLPYLDYCLYAIGLLGSPFGDCPWVGLTMRPSFHYRSMGVEAPKPNFAWIKEILFFRMLRRRSLKCLLTIDEPLAAYIEAMPLNAEKVVFYPEPAELGELPEPSAARQKLSMSPSRKLVLLYGAIAARKGVVELLQALAEPGFPTAVDVILAGKVVEPAIQKMLNESWVCNLIGQGRIKVIDRYIDPSEESTLFAAADIVWVGYRGHYNSSGILAQAVNAGRPVLACKGGVLGWQTRRHGLGLTVNPTDKAAVATAIGALLVSLSEKAARSNQAKPWRPATFDAAQDMLAHVLSAR